MYIHINSLNMEIKFELSQKVKHIANPEFDMVIKDFAVEWTNNSYKVSQQEKNPEYPICSYYNIHTNVWEEKQFHVNELIASDL